METLLLSLAQNGLGFTLFVLAVGVNVYQYKINQKLQDRRVDDWQVTLNTTNEIARAVQKSQDATAILVNGIDQTLKIILDRLDHK